MNNEISQITQQLFNRDSLEAVSVNELKEVTAKYPYLAPARFLLAKKEYDAYPSGMHDDVITAGLYFSNPLWFEWQLRRTLNEPAESSETAQEDEANNTEPTVSTSTGNEVQKHVGSTDESPIVFQSYHTIDYFASQGIRLQQADLSKDKLGQQLKSFTEWLRSMKKLPSAEVETVHTPDDDNRQQFVIRSAENSIVEKEVVTEAMAEVWAKQGNREKAIETYYKLSLLNPSKSAYFAAKIDQLK